MADPASQKGAAPSGAAPDPRETGQSDGPELRQYRVWDPLVRLFHWGLVAGFVANAFVTNAESRLHRQIGYLLLALVAARIIWGLIGTRHARFSDFPPSVRASLDQVSDMANGRERAHLGHSPLGALMIYNLLASVLAIAMTGWMMTTDAFWGFSWVKDMHEILVNWVMVSAAVHILAVIVESRRTGINLARAMVTGTKRVPNAVVVQSADHRTLPGEG